MKIYISNLPAKQIRQALKEEIQLKGFFARLGIVGVKDVIFGYVFWNMVIFCLHPESSQKAPLDNRLSFSVTCFMIPRKSKTYLITYCHPQYSRLFVAPIVIFAMLTTIMSLVSTGGIKLAFSIWLSGTWGPLLIFIGLFLFGQSFIIDLMTGLFRRHYGKVEEIIKQCAKIGV